MSYCRWGPDSDVYIFMGAGDHLHCCGCSLRSPGAPTDFVARDHRDMLRHLEEHEQAGHRVPADAIEELQSATQEQTP